MQRMRRWGVLPVAGAILLFASAPRLIHAQEDSNWDAGANVYLLFGSVGTRTGDVGGYGGFVRYHYNDHWVQRVGVDFYRYDLETPIDATEINDTGDPVDSLTIVWRFHTDLEYHFRPGMKWDPYFAGGVGYYSIHAPDIDGPTPGGGRYELEIDTPGTVGLMAAAGSDWRIGNALSLGLVAMFQQTFADYEVKEKISGETGTINPFAVVGVTAPLTVHF